MSCDCHVLNFRYKIAIYYLNALKLLFINFYLSSFFVGKAIKQLIEAYLHYCHPVPVQKLVLYFPLYERNLVIKFRLCSSLICHKCWASCIIACFLSKINSGEKYSSNCFKEFQSTNQQKISWLWKIAWRIKSIYLVIQ